MNINTGEIKELSWLGEQELASDEWMPLGDEAMVEFAGLSPRERVLWLKNNMRNAPCPCGSGKKFKKCHRWMMEVARKKLDGRP